jgi:RNA polymerase-binding transcription factor DksA
MDRAPDETVTFERVEPRLFGVVPARAAFVLGLTILVIALVGFALGHPVLGAALLVPTFGLLALSVEAARRFGRNDAASRAAGRVREWGRFALASTAARSRASRDLLAARSELARLRAEFRQAQLELGGAAYREDANETARLRARMRELEEQARAVERGTHRAVDEAEERIGEERLAIQPTEIVPPPGAE